MSETKKMKIYYLSYTLCNFSDGEIINLEPGKANYEKFCDVLLLLLDLLCEEECYDCTSEGCKIETNEEEIPFLSKMKLNIIGLEYRIGVSMVIKFSNIIEYQEENLGDALNVKEPQFD